MRIVLASVLVFVALISPGCGGGDGGDNGSDNGGQAASPGAQVYADAGCGNCHTLAAAGSTGTVGPNLDDAGPSAEEVEQQVREGGGGMPSFKDQLSDQEIKDVAEYVASSVQ